MASRDDATPGAAGAGPRDAGCLGPELALGFVRGRLAGDELARVELHVDRCPACLQFVAELVERSAAYEATRPDAALAPTLPDPRAGAEPAEGLERLLLRGASLGRYVIDGMLGSGGMGVVYAAYDPKLDRKVALKVLRDAPAGGQGGPDPLLAEARAMAKLSHPNVVAVYDVGVHDGQLFLALEYVDGVTLRSWLRRESRPLRETLGAFRQAGQGLAAAHAGGVVHRDFKPDNVLVDARGRVCVTDFGLARTALGPGDGPPHGPGPAPSGRRPGGGQPAGPATRTGVLAGTPAYMAPEQHAGRPADAKSDQFAFCVALYEALYGRRPFEGETWPALARSVLAGELRPPPARAGVPARVQRALERGLSADPARRFATMAELLDALADQAGPRRRRALALLGAGLAAGSLALGHWRAGAGARPLCGGPEPRLEGAWGAARKAAVRAALLGTGKPFAADTWARVERALDGYARDWAAARVDACEATHVRGEQSAELLDLRMACLDERLGELGALADVLARADERVLPRAVGAALALAPLAPCADRKALLARVKPPADPATAARVEALRADLARSLALSNAGKYREALDVATAASVEADALGYRPALGEALLRVGAAQNALEDVGASEATLWRALAAADAAGDDATRAAALVTLLNDVSLVPAERGLIAPLNDQAAAAIARAGAGPELDARRRVNYAVALHEAGDDEGAVRECEGAVALAGRALGPDHPLAQRCLALVGRAHAGRGDYGAAVDALGEVLAVKERTLGPDHPALGPTLSDLAGLLYYQLRLDEAEADVERAARIEAASAGPDSVALATLSSNLGVIQLERGLYERALPHLLRALAVGEQKRGADSPGLAISLTALGEAYLGLGDRPRALAHLERAAPLLAEAQEPIVGARARFALARALWASPRDRPRARALAAAARDLLAPAAQSPLEQKHLRLIEQWLARAGALARRPPAGLARPARSPKISSRPAW
jgi:eukaryotic-like serine/threonine-protein kinase